jgi:lysosomal alpha-mannosidase
MGSDFQYSNSHLWFKNLDKLINYVNDNNKNESSNGDKKLNVFYSTPACYLYALNQANITEWPTKKDDFFPYAHRPHSYWTGYFTSRSALKYFERRTNNYLQTIRQLTVLANLKNETLFKDCLGKLERAMGVAQHHDAVSGTERQHVAKDYSKRLSNGISGTINVILESLKRLVFTDLNNVYFCTLLNQTQCDPIENESSFTIIVYNPLARPLSTWLRIPVVDTNYIVIDNQKKQLIVDFVPVYSETKKIPERNTSKANYAMLFNSNISGLSFQTYFVNRKKNEEKIALISVNVKEPFSFENNYLKLNFDANGNLNSIQKNEKGLLNMNLSQNYCYYKSMTGDNSIPDKQASGAYIFRPQTNSSLVCFTVQNYTINRGSQFSEVHQIYNEWISQTIRLYTNATDVEFEWQIGPIDVENGGKEVITRFNTDLESDSTFYTDSNGREMLERKLNYRPTWPLEVNEPISGNYYPINTRIYIRDEINDASRQLTLITDRSQGASSLKNGSIEVMLHRRLLFDDSLGVSEPLNETGIDGKGLVNIGKLNLLFSSIENAARLHRNLAMEVNMKPLLIFSKDSSLIGNVNSKVTFNLPPNLHLLSLINDFDSTLSVLSVTARFEHFFEKNEDEEMSKPVSVDLGEAFQSIQFRLVGIEELSLGANMPVEDLNERLKWEHKSAETKIKAKTKTISSFVMNFEPMQIRTFRLYLI